MHRRFNHWGSKGLRARVAAVKPFVHIFGHVHNSHGCAEADGTLFINAAQVRAAACLVATLFGRELTDSTPAHILDAVGAYYGCDFVWWLTARTTVQP